MNRGKRKLLVTGLLVAASIVVALLFEVIDGTSGGAATPKATRTTITRGLAAPNATIGSLGPANYKTVGSFVNLRSGPSTTSSVVTNMAPFGSQVTLTCYTQGSDVLGDPWWYRASVGAAQGYVSGYWVNTGPDPAKTHLPAC